ncbi:DUF397 domain-containing protein [Actinomadura hibisca]|uniref:DUF397 domain-containing protein n=1 Tax=Actinomadura hibisca TaxID=68565 RepID=UPI000A06DAF2|nr:DUF397 domain-containing protein [Actinomadura hibisca]
MSAPELTTAVWRKSSRSNGAGGECVEVANVRPGIAIRDSKHPSGPSLSLDPQAWDALIHRIKAGSHHLT